MLFLVIGSFSNDNGDGNVNGEKAIGTLHMLHAFLYISLLSLHDNDLNMPNLTFYGGRKLAPTNFSFSFKT